MELTVEFAGPSDDAGIRALMQRQAMPGRIRLAFAREPDFSRGCAVTGDDYKIVVARARDEIVGVACRSVRNVFINGRQTRIGYLGQLRVDDRFQGRWLVSRGFALLGEVDRCDPMPGYLASIVDGNDAANAILVKRRKFREVAKYRTLAIPLRWSTGFSRSRPTEVGAPLEEIIRFLRSEGSRRQFFPAWTEESLRNLDGLSIEDTRVARRDGAIAGVMALWDQTSYKQSIVRGYSGWMRIAQPFLPRVGEEIRSAYAALICAPDPDVFADLLRDVVSHARERRFDYLLVGLDARDPNLQIAQKFRHYAYPSTLYLTDGGLHEQLDQRPAYVDIATL